METRAILCDNCQNDITYRFNSVDYILQLSSITPPLNPGINTVTDMFIQDPLGRPYHFCGKTCLGKWVSESILR